MAAFSLPDDWNDRAVSRLLDMPDDSPFICEAMRRLDMKDFADLSTADQSVVLGLALHLKRCE